MAIRWCPHGRMSHHRAPSRTARRRSSWARTPQRCSTIGSVNVVLRPISTSDGCGEARPIPRVSDVTERPEFSRRTHVAELIAVAAIVFVIVMGTAHIEPEGAERAVDALAYVCGIGGALSLLLWRRAPAVMVGIVAVAIFTYFARSYPPGPALLPGPISLVLLGLRAKRAVAWTGAIVMWAAVTLGLTLGDGRGDRLALAAVGWTLAAVFAGQLVAARRERIVADRERRRLTEYQAVTDERLRIAQDLHDSVAHAMATINVQAGTAAHLLARRPDE